MNVKEYYVEFDGGQLAIRTDVERVARFVESTYSQMLVHGVGVVEVPVGRPRSSIGKVEITRTAAGFALAGEPRVTLEGDDVEPILPLLKEEILLQFMRARPDLLWLHGGAVIRNGRALVICGRSGRGKSTLVTLLCERGWQLMSDDVAPVRMHEDEVLPFFQTPVRRVFPGTVIPEADVSELPRELVELTPALVFRYPARIGALVFPEFAGGSPADLRPLAAGDSALEILRNARNIVDHKAAAVDRAAAMARTIPAWSLEYLSPAEAVRRLDSLW